MCFRTGHQFASHSAAGWQNLAVVSTELWRSRAQALQHMREVNQVSQRISTARHRATPEKGATLEAMTQVMGRSGRKAAVIAAASGMVLTVPPAANAAPVQTDRETSTLPATKDRKSTRLNSSHVAISYAVFC